MLSHPKKTTKYSIKNPLDDFHNKNKLLFFWFRFVFTALFRVFCFKMNRWK